MNPFTKKIRLNFDKPVRLLKFDNIHTVCEESSCPNRYECSQNGVATYLIGGRLCTRACKFCDVETYKPQQNVASLREKEERDILESVKKLNNKYVVITSVARDDDELALAKHFASITNKLKSNNLKVELLIPDFHAKEEYLSIIGKATPLVISHNIETVARLSRLIRPQASYERSLQIYRYFYSSFPDIIRKAGMMIGLGETLEEIKHTIDDLKNNYVDIISIGQYMQPSDQQITVKKYWKESVFKEIKDYCTKKQFLAFEVGPFVRSSYMAAETIKLISEKRNIFLHC